jgi:hypothetical protein
MNNVIIIKEKAMVYQSDSGMLRLTNGDDIIRRVLKIMDAQSPFLKVSLKYILL